MGTFYSKTLISNIHVAHSVWGYRNMDRRTPSAMRRSFSTATGTDARTFNAQVQAMAVNSLMEVNVTNRLHAKFVAKLGESSSFGATLTAEARETFSMISGTVLRCLRAARCVKRFDFAGCARELGLPYRERTITKTYEVGSKMVNGRKRPRRYIRSRKRVFTLPTGREVEKTMANGWLLWSYGVKPLASDIYNGLDVLQRPFDYQTPVRCYASDSGTETFRDGGPGTSSYLVIDTLSGSVQGACGAWVTVTNPNAYLLNKMGLANPLQWILEAIPFSFVVDWFSNLSQVVGQWTDFYGYSFERTWRSYKYKATHDQVTFSPYGGGFSAEGFVFQRYLDLPKPKLVFAYERFGVERAANAISLLVGFLPGSRR